MTPTRFTLRVFAYTAAAVTIACLGWAVADQVWGGK